MTGWPAILAIGFFLGMRHATDPDHVIAITTFISRNGVMRRAAVVGLFWGIGHTLTVLVVGGGIVLFGWVIPPRIGLSMEFSVGLMLVTLGAISLASVRSGMDEEQAGDPAGGTVHTHPHVHGDYIHTHPHGHTPERHPHAPDRTPVTWLDRRFGGLAMYRPIRPLVVGMVHGLAGSAAVALLVLAAIRTPVWAVLYLVVFGVGTIIGMMLITALIAVPFAVTPAGSERLRRGLRLTAGVISIGFGLYLAWRTGFVDGLFLVQPA